MAVCDWRATRSETTVVPIAVVSTRDWRCVFGASRDPDLVSAAVIVDVDDRMAFAVQSGDGALGVFVREPVAHCPSFQVDSDDVVHRSLGHCRRWRPICRIGRDYLPVPGSRDLLGGTGEGQEPEPALVGVACVDSLGADADDGPRVALTELNLGPASNIDHVDRVG